MGKIVIISALDATYKRDGFDNILQLIPKAEKVKKLTSICRGCNKNASFTFRTIESEQLELIGSNESYMPLCRPCFIHAEAQMNEKRKLHSDEVTADSSNVTCEKSHFNNSSIIASGSSDAGSEENANLSNSPTGVELEA
jgi:hypothetical protein